MFVHDPESNIRFLVDTGTGSSVSLLPVRRHLNDPRLSTYLHTADGTKSPAFETVSMTLSLGFNRFFTWNFLTAHVRYPVIGLDFLDHFDMLVDGRNKKLIPLKCDSRYGTDTNNCGQDGVSLNASSVSGTATPPFNFDKTDVCADLPSFFPKYPTVFELKNFNRPTRHQNKHYIRTEGPPVCSRVRRLSPEKLDALRVELDHLLELGIIEPANSPYASPVQLVSKSNGSYRVTGDYRLLNKQTVSDKYAIPLLTDFAFQLHGCKRFSSLDLFKSYHQIEIADEDVPKTAIITPLRSYVFRRLPMGLKSAGNTFQRFMDEAMRGLDFVYIYIDDILIFSKDEDEHLKHLSLVFQRLDHYGFILNQDKCIFNVNEIDFLGHHVSKAEIKPLDSKIAAIRDFPKPNNMRQLRRFLGMIAFHKRFIPHAADILAPLNRLLSPRHHSRKLVDWNEEALAVFDKIKQVLGHVTMLSFPVKGAPTFLSTDSSSVAVGSVLQQEIGGHLESIAFFSTALSRSQQNYSTFDRELLAVFLSVKHFRYFLEGRPFTILTDHKPLTHSLGAPLKDANSRQIRQLNYISEFTSDIQYIKGERNVIADCLSRPPDIVALISESEPLDFAAISQEQTSDPEVLNLIADKNHSLKLEPAPLPDSDLILWGDMSTGTFRPLIPKKYRASIFDCVHNLAHPGIKASQQLVSERFVWPRMKTDVRNFVKSCIACQKAKVLRHNMAPLQRFSIPDQRFQHIHLDLVGPLPVSQGFSYLLTVIDRYTRHTECIPLKDTTAETCANAFVLNWVARFGCPETLTTDRGCQFLSKLWQDLCEFLGTRHITTCSYHPISNGMIERFHRSLKSALKAHEDPSGWMEHLGFVLLGLRAALKEDLGCSSSELAIGCKLRLPGQFFTGNQKSGSYTDYRRGLEEFMASLRPTAPREPDRRESYLQKELFSCSHVFVKNEAAKTSLDCPYKGPYRVLKRQDKVFTIDFGTRVDTVSVDRLKAANLLLSGSETPDANPQSDDFLTAPEPTVTHELLVEVDSPPRGILKHSKSSSSHSETTSPSSSDLSFDNAPVIRTRRGRTIHRPVRYWLSIDN